MGSKHISAGFIFRTLGTAKSRVGQIGYKGRWKQKGNAAYTVPLATGCDEMTEVGEKKPRGEVRKGVSVGVGKS